MQHVINLPGHFLFNSMRSKIKLAIFLLYYLAHSGLGRKLTIHKSEIFDEQLPKSCMTKMCKSQTEQCQWDQQCFHHVHNCITEFQSGSEGKQLNKQEYKNYVSQFHLCMVHNESSEKMWKCIQDECYQKDFKIWEMKENVFQDKKHFRLSKMECAKQLCIQELNQCKNEQNCVDSMNICDEKNAQGLSFKQLNDCLKSKCERSSSIKSKTHKKQNFGCIPLT